MKTHSSSGTQRSNLLYFGMGLLPVLMVYLTYLLLGQNAHFEILDNLEAEPLLRDMLRRDLRTSPGDGLVQQTMNGLPRVCMPSDLNVTTWIHYLLPSFAAYMTNLALVMFVGYAGTWLLMRKRLLPSSPAWIAAGVAACFGVLPLFPEYGISVAGQPLLLLALLWIHDRKHLALAGGVVALFLFWSSLYLVGLFVLAALGVAWVFVSFRQRKIHVPMLLAMLCMGAGYFLVENRIMMETFVHHSFVPHREEFALIPPTTFKNSIGSSLTFLLYGFYHAPTHSKWMLLPLLSVAGIGWVQWLRRRADGLWKGAAVMGALVVIASFAIGFTHWTPLENAFQKVSFFRQFNRERLFFLLPLLWYVLLGLACAIAWRNKFMKYAAPLLLALQCLFILAHHNDFNVNVRRLQAGVEPTRRDDVNTYSWRTFYAEEVMQQVEDHIGRPMENYRVACIGIKPALTQHHGFYTLDLYNNLYPLDYKHSFRRIMAAELDKSPFNKKYFDEWGNRCVILPAEEGDTLHHLALDISAFRDMGGEYLLSHPFILNSDSLGLKLEAKWVDPEFPDRVHLYKVAAAAQLP
jgi:hypothetical protein